MWKGLFRFLRKIYIVRKVGGFVFPDTFTVRTGGPLCTCFDMKLILISKLVGASFSLGNDKYMSKLIVPIFWLQHYPDFSAGFLFWYAPWKHVDERFQGTSRRKRKFVKQKWITKKTKKQKKNSMDMDNQNSSCQFRKCQ